MLDDDRYFYESVAEMLAESECTEFSLDYAANIASAVKLVEAQTYDYHIVDYCLSGPGGETGLEFVKKLLTLRDDAPIGLCTGHDLGDEQSSMVLGSECVELIANGTMRFLRKDDLTGRTLEHAILSACSRRIRVLVVDDDPDDLDMITEMLENSPIYYFEVDTARTLAEAKGRVLRETHDVFVLDYRLGVETSTELVSSLFQSSINRPVILLTQYSPVHLDEELVRLIGSGELIFVSKGHLNRDKLLQILLRSFYQPIWLPVE